MREADEGHEVVLAERREGDVAHHHHLVVAGVEGDAQVFAGVDFVALEQFDVHVGDASRRLHESVARRVLADGLEELAHERLHALDDRPRLGLAGEGVNRVEVAVALVDVEAVAHDEVRRDREADVLERLFDALLALFEQQRADLEALGAARAEVLAQVVEREPGVDDVLDDQHVAAEQVDVEVLHDAHDAAGLGRGAVGRDRHEVDLDGEFDRAHEVGHEVDGALQDADEQRRVLGVVAR